MSKNYRETIHYATYRVFKEKRKYVVRKFTGFDHSWAEYSKPLAIFDSESEANEYIDSLETTNDI